jgi:hypothetical protein
MKKRYIACFDDLLITKDNWLHGEDPKSGRYFNPALNTVYFDTIDELREIVAAEFTNNVDTEQIYIDDNGDNRLFITWYSIDDKGWEGVNKKNEARYKKGEIDLYSCYMNVEVFKFEKVNCPKEFKDELRDLNH